MEKAQRLTTATKIINRKDSHYLHHHDLKEETLNIPNELYPLSEQIWTKMEHLDHGCSVEQEHPNASNDHPDQYRSQIQTPIHMRKRGNIDLNTQITNQKKHSVARSQKCSQLTRLSLSLCLFLFVLYTYTHLIWKANNTRGSSKFFNPMFRENHAIIDSPIFGKRSSDSPNCAEYKIMLENIHHSIGRQNTEHTLK